MTSSNLNHGFLSDWDVVNARNNTVVHAVITKATTERPRRGGGMQMSRGRMVICFSREMAHFLSLSLHNPLESFLKIQLPHLYPN